MNLEALQLGMDELMRYSRSSIKKPTAVSRFISRFFLDIVILKSSITLDIYGHLIPSMQVEAAEMIDELVTPVKLLPIAPETNPRINIEA
jgi:hypothetical protein